jgi:HSP20 family protein
MELMEPRFSTPLDAFSSLDHFTDRWPDMVTWPMLGWEERAVGVLRVDEYREDGALVVRAEVPGIDPDKDLQVTASEGVLHITVERHDEAASEGRSYLRHEIVHRHRLGRDLGLPEGAEGSEFKATYDDGVLEIRMPLPPQRVAPPVTRISVTKG